MPRLLPAARAAADLRRAAPDGLGAAPAHGPRPAIRTRRSRRCCKRATASRGRRGQRASRSVATSGPAPATCCTWTGRSYARFERPGHAVTGDRTSRPPRRSARVGYDYAHAIVDDHSRLGYAELLDDEARATVTAFVERALAFFAAHGIEPEAADDRQRLELHEQPLAARAARTRARIRHLSTPAAARSRTGRSSASTRRWPASGPTASATALPTPRRRAATLARATTTSADHTAPSAAYPRSAAFTTSVGRTARSRSAPGSAGRARQSTRARSKPEIRPTRRHSPSSSSPRCTSPVPSRASASTAPHPPSGWGRGLAAAWSRAPAG